MLDHLNPTRATPIEDMAVFDLYRRNFGVALPDAFADVLAEFNGAYISAVYTHPELHPDQNKSSFRVSYQLTAIGLQIQTGST